eukprot:TRINITY_DN1029_c0_g2_i1.p1 TRINITY_DN1029_c0_g2~~TRINITY_DN1029_c0_g2_i1.p1  ORF type:complete len:151 (-),score=50.26 TRINITY_DN1029_c0_g2_i1:60-512(-)
MCIRDRDWSSFFFFQAEDGIRDAQESRGLGDVYKRQYQRRVHGIETKQLVYTIKKAHKGWIKQLVLSQDNNYLVSASSDKSIKIWNLENQQLEYAQDDAHDGEIQTVVISSDNKLLASGSSDSVLKLWSLELKGRQQQFQQKPERGTIKF